MNKQTYEEATAWFVEFRTGEVDQDLRRQFDAWVRQSPQNLCAYLEITEIWQDAADIDAARTPSADELIALSRTDHNIIPVGLERRTSSPPSVTGARSWHRYVLIAASLLITTGLTAWYYTQRGTYTTGIGEQRIVTLADGTAMHLNSRSKVRVRFEAQQRDVDLVRGQALFHVAKDTTRPFIVATDDTRVRAVGTRFDVYRKQGATTVTVVEGRVAILPRSPVESAQTKTEMSSVPDSRLSSLLLIAGQQLTIRQDLPRSADAPVVTEADVSAATAWTERRLVFKSSPLSNVIDEFNRYNERQLRLADPSLAGFQISGVYTSTDPALLLRFLREQPGIAVDDTGEDIVVGSK